MGEHIALTNIVKSYGTRVITTVLHGISLSINNGEFLSIIGQSGSGKSTLLNLIGILDRPNSGQIVIDGTNINTLSDDELALLRNKNIGFVFQFHYLLPEFSALENVLIPWRMQSGRTSTQALARAKELLEKVGVADRMNNRSTDLSGGQQQRVAIARAMMNKPMLILADEPTGNLDSDTSENIRKLMRDINKAENTTFILVTHDRHIADSCDRVIEIADGRIVSDIKTAMQSAPPQQGTVSA
jgi:lipoprotein-releasing system ATP-binding protein